MGCEAWVVQQPDPDEFYPRYRWEDDSGYSEDLTFEEGDAICIDPFEDCWMPVYGEFIRYVTDTIAEIYLPPRSDDAWPTHCLTMPEGNYYIHEGYLKPH